MARRLQEVQQKMVTSDDFNRYSEPSGLNLEREIQIREIYGSIFCLRFSFDEECFAVGYGSGALELRESKKGSIIHDLRQAQENGFPVMCLRFSPANENLLYATTAEGVIYIYDIVGGIVKHIIYERGNEINALDFNYGGSHFTTGGKDLKIRVYDSKTSDIVQEYSPPPFFDDSIKGGEASLSMTRRIFCIKYHPNELNIFISSGWDNDLKIWDSRASFDGVKRRIVGPHICGESLDMLNGKILTGSWVASDALCVWNYTAGTLLKNVPFPSVTNCSGEFIYCCKFCDNDTVFAGGSGTNSAHLIRISDGQCLGGLFFKKPVFALDCSKDGKDLVVGGSDRVLKMVKVF